MKTHRITLTVSWHILALVCLFVFLFMAGIGYGGYKLYQKVLATEAAQKAIVEEQKADQLAQEERAKQLLLAQQTELAGTKSELERTKQEAQATQATIKTLTKTVEERSKQQDIVISSNDLLPYVTGVVQVVCSSGAGVSSGSGSLFTFKELKTAVLTNHHVVEGASKCVVMMTDTANTTTGMFALDPTIYTYNEGTDEAVLSIGQPLAKTTVPIDNYNYSISNLKKCSSLLPVGTPVVIVGFPAYAKRDAVISIETIGKVNSIYRTTTNGIISGYDTSSGGEANYFVSAKIDNGNSGGMALAKNENGLCILGLPTWLTVGNYETQGLVQNISNLLPK